MVSLPSASQFDTAHPRVGLSTAVVLPCYNEAATIADVIAGFAEALPGAVIYVFDNNSSDNTARVAENAGAIVIREMRQGKGHVVRRMFAEVDADIYVMADGDGTYAAADAPTLVQALVERRLDMVVGTRRGVRQDAGRSRHALGNRLFNGVFQWMFGDDFSDIFSGYRVFSRRFAKSFPAVSRGFEIETEMSVHASQLMLPVAEIETDYGVRPEGSESKLRTFRDGFRILSVFFLLLKETRPAFFFGGLATLLTLASLVFGLPVVAEYLQTGLVPRIPTAVLAAALMIIAVMSAICGLILDSVSRSRVELKRMFLLMQRGLPTP
ncbi:MAG: glycosyltransferase [Pseudomonadota bacterium]|nr:glycosyltransferase [Pseudomonadota bacterium]